MLPSLKAPYLQGHKWARIDLVLRFKFSQEPKEEAAGCVSILFSHNQVMTRVRVVLQDSSNQEGGRTQNPHSSQADYVFLASLPAQVI